jgi:hypothetical protein
MSRQNGNLSARYPFYSGYKTTFGSEVGIPYGFAFIKLTGLLINLLRSGSFVSRDLKDKEDTRDMTERISNAYKIEEVCNVSLDGSDSY